MSDRSNPRKSRNRPSSAEESARRSVERNVDNESTLRLSVAGGALGLETYRPISLGPLCVEFLSWSLPSLKFPIDLSGGVDAFRHRRGELRRLTLSAQRLDLEQALTARVKAVHGSSSGRVSLWALNPSGDQSEAQSRAVQGIGVGVRREEGSVAFDMHWIPTGNAARVVICNARTSGAEDVPLGQALRMSDTLFGRFSKRSGRVLTIDMLATKLTQHVAPLLGTRAPASAGASVAPLVALEASWQLTMGSALTSPALPVTGIQALELALLCREADDQLAAGYLEEARRGYLDALERAPRHPQLVRLIAEIDAASQEQRGEAALSMLVDCLPAAQFGAVGATLLARTGDLPGARHAAEQAASHEIYAPVSAELWARLAELSENAEDQRVALDRAVSTAPGLPKVRWERFAARVDWQDERGAVADAEHLEAAARGAKERHKVLLRCGSALVAAGLINSAGEIFERALRYLPDDPAATHGLALALLGTRKRRRAMTLLERAVEVSEQRGAVLVEAVLELAQQLAEQAGDHPQAIARISQVPASRPRLFLRAKALEGRWRAAVGDLKGASLAFAQLREICEREGNKPSIRHAAPWLSEAAEFERNILGEIAVAERHLAEAIRLAPKNRRIRSEYRAVAALLVEKR